MTMPVQPIASDTLALLGTRRAIVIYSRIALGSAFLSAVASRLGFWDRSIDYGHFQNFLKYAAEVNSFMPAVCIPFLAWSATIAETVLGIALLVGIRLRLTAFCA